MSHSTSTTLSTPSLICSSSTSGTLGFAGHSHRYCSTPPRSSSLVDLTTSSDSCSSSPVPKKVKSVSDDCEERGVKELHQMFPNVDLTVCEQVLDVVSWNFTLAIEILVRDCQLNVILD